MTSTLHLRPLCVCMPMWTNTVQTASTLGPEREGAGIVIDENGLILTVGYIIVEGAECDHFDPWSHRTRGGGGDCL
jgi:hypothetical protein